MQGSEHGLPETTTDHLSGRPERDSGLVSVAMPAYNSAAYVGEAIESIIAQTYQNWELIVFDDASDDQTPEIVAGYAEQDERIRLLCAERNVGPCAGRNRAIAAANGEFIAIMDADDVCLPQRFALSIAALRDEPELGLVGGTALLIDQEGTVIGRRPEKPLNDQDIEHLIYERQIAPFDHPSWMLRMCVIEQLGGYDEFYRHSSDYDLVLRLSARFPIRHLPQPLIKYRTCPGQISVVNGDKHFAYVRTAMESFRARQAGQDFDLSAEFERQLIRARQELGPLGYGPLRAHYVLGRTYLASNKPEKARQEFAQVLCEMPWAGKTRAKWLWAVVLSLKKRLVAWATSV